VTEVEKHLNTARSLAHQMRIPTDSVDFDDIVQEGAVAAWLATKDIERRDPVTYGMVAARRRITGTLRGKHPMYGSEAEPGKRIHDQFRQTQNREIDAEGALSGVPWRRDPFSEVERRIDVDRALSELEARDRVIAGMVGRGYPWAEIAEAVGMSQSGCFNRWRYVLRPELGYLLEAVA